MGDSALSPDCDHPCAMQEDSRQRENVRVAAAMRELAKAVHQRQESERDGRAKPLQREVVQISPGAARHLATR